MPGGCHIDIGERQPRPYRDEEEGARRCEEKCPRTQMGKVVLPSDLLPRWGLSGRRARVARLAYITLREEPASPGPKRRGPGKRVPPGIEQLEGGIRGRSTRGLRPEANGGGAEARRFHGEACEGLRCRGPLRFRLHRTLG